jgi:glycosyltransferase involved in cell wall biosynthesis
VPRASGTTGDLDGVSVVIPAFNEAGGVGDQVRAVDAVLRQVGRPFEILVVDDGSTDRTAEIAATLPCRLLRQPENRGYGASLLRGLATAAHETVVIIDADGTYPAEAIPILLERARDCDMVVGARTGAKVEWPLARRPARWFLRKLASYLAEREIPDLNSGLRVLRRTQVERFRRILPSGFSFTTTITLAFICNEYRVAYVPIDYRKRVGDSKIRPIDAWNFTLLILRAMVLFNPLRVFLPLGLLLFLAGSAKFVYDIFRDNLSESAVMGILGAILIWSFGLLADQNARLGLDRRPGDGA